MVAAERCSILHPPVLHHNAVLCSQMPWLTPPCPGGLAPPLFLHVPPAASGSGDRRLTEVSCTVVLAIRGTE